jgi:hypothetical protein
MSLIKEFVVTLSDDLADHLHGVATKLDVPLEWLVVGIVCDTIESSTEVIPAPAAG